MTFDQSERAEQIVKAAKANRPWWRAGVSRAPSWFAGEELDLLEPAERLALYQELGSSRKSPTLVLMVIALGNLANAVRGIQSQATRGLWIAMVAGFALVAMGAGMYRRRSMLGAARQRVRERADWPLRLNASAVTSPTTHDIDRT